MSKRKLIQLVEEKHVDGLGRSAHADHRRLSPARLHAARRMRLFAERIGVSKADSLIDVSVLEDCLREDLNERAPRASAVLDPLKLIIDNYPAQGSSEPCEAPVHPAQAGVGQAQLSPSAASCGSSARTSWNTPAKGYFRLFPGNPVRLRYGYRGEVQSAATRMPPATSPPCIANTCRTPSPARRAPTPTR